MTNDFASSITTGTSETVVERIAAVLLPSHATTAYQKVPFDDPVLAGMVEPAPGVTLDPRIGGHCERIDIGPKSHCAFLVRSRHLSESPRGGHPAPYSSDSSHVGGAVHMMCKKLAALGTEGGISVEASMLMHCINQHDDMTALQEGNYSPNTVIGVCGQQQVQRIGVMSGRIPRGKPERRSAG